MPDQVQTGISDIQKIVDRTQTGTADLSKTTTQTQAGQAVLQMRQFAPMFDILPHTVGIVLPLTQSSTNATLPVIDSNCYTAGARKISFTISVATNDVTWSVWGANVPTFEDEVAVLSPASVVAGAFSSYSDHAVFLHYRVKIVDTVGGSHGVAVVSALMKT